MSSNHDNSKNAASRPSEYGYSEFSPRLWHGMTLGPWAALLKGNLAKIAPRRIPLALSITLTSATSSLIAGLSRMTVARKAARHAIDIPPIFILGYWRSGTTLLNEILVADRRHCSPNTFQCLTPETFLLTQRFAGLIDRLIPDRRPMDAMDFGMALPQEDELAMLNMGFKTPYSYLAFPSNGVRADNQHRFWPQNEAEWSLWLAWWKRFLAQVSYANQGRRLILKSPPHTARIAKILEVFPDARFVHISRHPHALFASNIKMNKAMGATQSLERNLQSDATLEKGVVTMHNIIYEAFFAERKMIAPSAYCETRYEDLTADYDAEMRRIYRMLGLGDIEPSLPAMRAMMAERAGYQADRYELSKEQKTLLAVEWRRYIREFGYSAAA